VEAVRRRSALAVQACGCRKAWEEDIEGRRPPSPASGVNRRPAGGVGGGQRAGNS